MRAAWIPVFPAALLTVQASGGSLAATHQFEADVLGIRVGRAEMTIGRSAAGHTIAGRRGTGAGDGQPVR